MISLYEYRDPTTGVLTNGAYPLLDAIDCTVTEQRNGMFELVMRYPLKAQYADMLIPDAIIMATPRPNAAEEPFRIVTIEQVIEGVITVRANHIVYDLDGSGVYKHLINGATFENVLSMLNTLVHNIGLTASGIAGFDFANDGITDSVTTFDFGSDVHISFWQAAGMVAEQFNAELKYEWDAANQTCIVYFCAARGVARNTIITYGVNIANLNRRLSADGLYSDVRVYWTQNGGQTVVWNSRPTGYTKRKRILWLDVTDQFQSAPTSTQLADIANAYIAAHDFNPTNDLSVDFVPLDNTTEYEPNIAKVGSAIVGISRVSDGYVLVSDALYLCDTATVDASLIGVSATAKCVKVEYNVLTNKYNQITIGTLRDDIVDTILAI